MCRDRRTGAQPAAPGRFSQACNVAVVLLVDRAVTLTALVASAAVYAGGSHCPRTGSGGAGDGLLPTADDARAGDRDAEDRWIGGGQADSELAAVPLASLRYG
jgi:hypothetical protein